MTAPLCPTHRRPLVQFCPACRGQAGGRQKSDRKTVAVQYNATRPRKRKPKPS